MAKILDICKEKEFMSWIDETYVEFAEDFNTITSVPLASTYDNIIILRGISKLCRTDYD